MRIVITGSRAFNDDYVIETFMHRMSVFQSVYNDDVTIVHGAAVGVDRIAAKFAKDYCLKVEAHPADWSMGRGAGFVRNEEMIRSNPDWVVAFWDGRSPGTKHMINLARDIGVDLTIYYEGDSSRVIKDLPLT